MSGATLRPTGAGFNTLTGDALLDSTVATSGDDQFLLDDPSHLAGSTLSGSGGSDRVEIQRSGYWDFTQCAAFDIGTVAGSDGADTILSGAGNDTVTGGAGNDDLYGEDGADQLDGGAGYDRLFGGAGNDMLFGGGSNDDLYGEDGDDQLDGGAGFDRLFGGAGNDVLAGGASGSDYLDGGDGDDSLQGAAGDTLIGGAGNDDLSVSYDFAMVDGGTGIDTLWFQSVRVKADLSAGTVTLYDGLEQWSQPVTGIENLRGSAFADTLIGDAGDNILDGRTGNDALTGGAGNDVFLCIMGEGSDTITDFAVGDRLTTFSRNGSTQIASLTAGTGQGIDAWAIQIETRGDGTTLVHSNIGGIPGAFATTTLIGSHSVDQFAIDGGYLRGVVPPAPPPPPPPPPPQRFDPIVSTSPEAPPATPDAPSITTTVDGGAGYDVVSLSGAQVLAWSAGNAGGVANNYGLRANGQDLRIRDTELIAGSSADTLELDTNGTTLAIAGVGSVASRGGYDRLTLTGPSNAITLYGVSELQGGDGFDVVTLAPTGRPLTLHDGVEALIGADMLVNWDRAGGLAIAGTGTVNGAAGLNQHIGLIGPSAVTLSNITSVDGSAGYDAVQLADQGGATIAVRDVDALIGTAAYDRVRLNGGATLGVAGIERVDGAGDRNAVALLQAGSVTVREVDAITGSTGIDSVTTEGRINTARALDLIGVEQLHAGDGYDLIRAMGVTDFQVGGSVEWLETADVSTVTVLTGGSLTARVSPSLSAVHLDAAGQSQDVLVFTDLSAAAVQVTGWQTGTDRVTFGAGLRELIDRNGDGIVQGAERDAGTIAASDEIVSLVGVQDLTDTAGITAALGDPQHPLAVVATDGTTSALYVAQVTAAGTTGLTMVAHFDAPTIGRAAFPTFDYSTF